MKQYIKPIIGLLILSMMVLATHSCSSDKDDDIDIGGGEPEKREMRLISYNILEGMKLDKANKYSNFVKWVQEQETDILALQEVNGFTQKSLEELAARYGHPYVVTNVKIGDNYPVALTSKHPIEIRRRLTKHVSHGCIFATIKGVNVVVTHLWPQGYWHEPGDNLGTEYRLHETRIFLDSTIYKYPTENKWLFMGDFNARSSIDADGNPGVVHDYRVHNKIEEADYADMLRSHLDVYSRTVPTVYGGWTPATTSTSRIDFVYGSPTMVKEMIKAEVIYDDFTHNFSDHYPTLVHFRY